MSGSPSAAQSRSRPGTPMPRTARRGHGWSADPARHSQSRRHGQIGRPPSAEELRRQGMAPWCATARRIAPSTRRIVTSTASHSRADVRATASNTGWTSAGELEMTRRIWLVAACCSKASVRACRRLSSSLVGSAYDRAVGLAPVRGAPHSPQNFCPLGFSCWHRGQGIWSGPPFRIVSGQPGTASRHSGRRQSSASRPFHGARAPRPYPGPASGTRWAVLGVVRPGPVGRTPWAAPTSQILRLRHAPDGYTPSWCPDPDPLEPPPEPAERDAVETAGNHPARRACLANRWVLGQGAAAARPLRLPDVRPSRSRAAPRSTGPVGVGVGGLGAVAEASSFSTWNAAPFQPGGGGRLSHRSAGG